MRLNAFLRGSEKSGNIHINKTYHYAPQYNVQPGKWIVRNRSAAVDEVLPTPVGPTKTLNRSLAQLSDPYVNKARPSATPTLSGHVVSDADHVFRSQWVGRDVVQKNGRAGNSAIR